MVPLPWLSIELSIYLSIYMEPALSVDYYPIIINKKFQLVPMPITLDPCPQCL